jgi:malonate-semialdehyde dehydrogenase (acetylating)/methylmalonate-semialdehyde dehydrogenase
MREIGHFIGGTEVKGASGRFGDVFDPNTGEAQARVAFAKRSEVEHAIAVAEAAQPAWATVNPQRRARVLMKFLELAQREFDSLARLLSSEHGKTFADAKGDVQRGLEVVELLAAFRTSSRANSPRAPARASTCFPCASRSAVAGITPFNFPAMIPMWKFAPALACNAFILKPWSDPLVPMRLAELLLKACRPACSTSLTATRKRRYAAYRLADKGDRVRRLLGHRRIRLYDRLRQQQARVCFGGAKNHMIVMPDADMDQASTR